VLFRKSDADCLAFDFFAFFSLFFAFFRLHKSKKVNCETSDVVSKPLTSKGCVETTESSYVGMVNIYKVNRKG
jgi:hypothetical protein